MKHARSFVIVLLVMSVIQFACGSSTPTQVAPSVNENSSVETATATSTINSISSPPPTIAQLRLEVVQSQAWTDYQGNVRTNVMLRNPYDFPVKPKSGVRAKILNSVGEVIRDDKMYFLDGISGGTGFILPGETIGATSCFTCETTPLPEEWDSVEFASIVEDATGSWDYFTEVEASNLKVSFDGDSPIFDVSGTVTNHSGSALDRISVRVFVFDQEGNLVGAAEVSAWDVGADATVNFDGYGIGQNPNGAVTYEVTALGVKY